MGVQQNPTFPFQQCDLLPDVSPRNALPPEGNQKQNFIPTDTVIIYILHYMQLQSAPHRFPSARGCAGKHAGYAGSEAGHWEELNCLVRVPVAA
jgi:hypothetical protein